MTTKLKETTSKGLKNSDLFLMKEVISRVKEKGSNQFKLPLILNEMKIDQHLKALEELRKPSKEYSEYIEEVQKARNENSSLEYKEFIEERNKLMVKHAELDKNGDLLLYEMPYGRGKIVKSGHGYPNMINDESGFEKELKKLKEKFSDAIAKDEERVTKELSDLSEKYKSAIDVQQKKQQEFEATLSDPADVELKKIPFHDFPEMGYEEMKVFLPIIEN